MATIAVDIRAVHGAQALADTNQQWHHQRRDRHHPLCGASASRRCFHAFYVKSCQCGDVQDIAQPGMHQGACPPRITQRPCPHRWPMRQASSSCTSSAVRWNSKAKADAGNRQQQHVLPINRLQTIGTECTYSAHGKCASMRQMRSAKRQPSPILMRLPPLCLARYSARSARWISASLDSAIRQHPCAAPILTRSVTGVDTVSVQCLRLRAGVLPPPGFVQLYSGTPR